MVARIVVQRIHGERDAADGDAAELGEGGGGRGEGGEKIEQVLGCEEVVESVWTEEGEGFRVDLARGEEERREGEGGVGEGCGAEVGGVDLIAEFEGELEKAGEGLRKGRDVSFKRFLTDHLVRREGDTIV